MIKFHYEGRAKLALIGQEEVMTTAREFEKISGVKITSQFMLLPLETRLFELLVSKLGGWEKAEADENVLSWYSSQIQLESGKSRLIAKKDYEIKHPLSEKLWPFQRVGANFISNNGRSLLCDDPGLGKTATTIVGTELATWHKKMLVICPNSLKGWWEKEITAWSKDEHPIWIINGKMDFPIDRVKEGWFIVNFERLIRMPKEFSFLFWDWIIIDEAHRVKNRKTKTFDCCRNLKARRKVLLTGTPFGNNPSEIWSLLNIVDPERYASYWRFFEMYVNYIQDAWVGTRTIVGTRNPDLLRRELSTIMIRRTKDEVDVQLPEKVHQVIPLILTPLQAELYTNAIRNMQVELANGEILDITSAIALITRLRQILSSPRSLGALGDSCKINAVLDYISSVDDKVIVFSQFRGTVEEICEGLGSEVSHVRLMGGDNVDLAVESFQNDPDCKVLVATTPTGGVGLTLTAANKIVFVEKHWNPMQQAQAEDRIHRIGQKKSCQIISLFCPNTIDQLVEDILNRKIQMTEEILAKELYKSIGIWLQAQGLES